MDSGDSLVVVMTHDAALVLLEMFADLRDEASVPIRDQAERRALWNLVCSIEKVLPEIFSSNYAERVEIAKKNLSR